MKEKKSKKRIFLIIFGIILFLALGGTVAYFAWNSTAEDKDATLSISSVDKSNSVCQKISDNNPKLMPVSTRDKGRVVKINAKQTLSEYAYITWTLTINSINTEGTETTGLKHASFKYEMVNETTNTSYGSGNFSELDEGDTITFSNNTENLDYNKNYTFVLYLWIDGTIGNNPLDMMDQTYSFDLVCDITGEGTNKSKASGTTAAEYITNLYLNNKDEIATYHEVDYQLATSVNLMNDRLGGTTKDLDGGDIRYYGANPNNYVWLGDTYTSDYTFDYNGEEITRVAGDKKLWRIIGVFDGRLKLIQNDPIGEYSWDTSANGVNDGFGINEWSQSDLMKLLNPGYDSESVNNSLYWNKLSGTVYTGPNNATTTNVSFVNTGLTSKEKNMIDTAIWYLGAYEPGEDNDYDGASYTDIQYASERQSTTLGKICMQGGTHCNDTVARTTSWNGKVGLMYPSDYGYATDFNECSSDLYYYDDEECYSNDWLLSNSSYWQWTMSPCAYSGYAHSVFDVDDDGYVMGAFYSSNAGLVHPAIYLKANVLINTTGKDGSEDYPYELSLN